MCGCFRFQRSVLRKGQLLKRGKAGALFGDRYAVRPRMFVCHCDSNLRVDVLALCFTGMWVGSAVISTPPRTVPHSVHVHRYWSCHGVCLEHLHSVYPCMSKQHTAKGCRMATRRSHSSTTHSACLPACLLCLLLPRLCATSRPIRSSLPASCLCLPARCQCSPAMPSAYRRCHHATTMPRAPYTWT